MSSALLECTLPSSWYRSTDVFKAEKERIFCREWIGVCREEELPQPGDYLVSASPNGRGVLRPSILP